MSRNDPSGTALIDSSGASACRLSPPEWAYLRAIAQGVPSTEAAKRFLGLEHGAALVTVDRDVTERARAIARRNRDSRWRLIGAKIATPDASAIPSVEAWAAAEGLSDWPWAELVDMHAEQFAVDAAAARRGARNARLIARRLALLRELEAIDQARPALSDALDGWFDPDLAGALQRVGDLTLRDLQARIGVGGRWWAVLPSYGPIKAERLAQRVQALVGLDALSAPADFRLGDALARRERLDCAGGANAAPAEAGCVLAEPGDAHAVAAWIAAKAGSEATARSYAREAERFTLYAAHVHGAGLQGVTVDLCRAYMDFLADVPRSWVSRRAVPLGAPGWAPFRGPLSLASQRQAITIVASLFMWLASVGYLQRDPWLLVNRRVGDDPARSNASPTSRAFTPEAWAALMAQAEAESATPAGVRMHWLLVFTEATGLRPSELVAARRAELVQVQRVWVLKVFGKGRRNREVVVPAVAVAATRRYFAARGLDFDAAVDAPLIGALPDAEGEVIGPSAGVAYSTLYRVLKRFIRRAAARLAPDEARGLDAASLHWLRHTFATRAIERGVPANDVQEQLGHADPRTTAAYSRAQFRQRAEKLDAAFT